MTTGCRHVLNGYITTVIQFSCQIREQLTPVIAMLLRWLYIRLDIAIIGSGDGKGNPAILVLLLRLPLSGSILLGLHFMPLALDIDNTVTKNRVSRARVGNL